MTASSAFERTLDFGFVAMQRKEKNVFLGFQDLTPPNFSQWENGQNNRSQTSPLPQKIVYFGVKINLFRLQKKRNFSKV